MLIKDHTLTKGDVLCFESRHAPFVFIFSAVISIAEKIGNIGHYEGTVLPIKPSKITHVALVLNEDFYIESVSAGVILKPVEKLKNKKNVWACILKDKLRDRLKENEGVFNEFINEQIGKPYDFIQLFKFLPYLLTFRMLFKPKEDIKLSVCSELIAAAFETVGIFKGNSSIITPSDIFGSDWFKDRVKINE